MNDLSRFEAESFGTFVGSSAGYRFRCTSLTFSRSGGSALPLPGLASIMSQVSHGGALKRDSSGLDHFRFRSGVER